MTQGSKDEASNESCLSRWRKRYSDPLPQVIFLGFVCFMCLGMFNALLGLGAAGQVYAKAPANSAAAVYATTAVFSFFSGSINNILGTRLTLILGTLGYPIYISSFLVLNLHPHTDGYLMVAGVIVGISSALLWTAQGSIMLAYPTEAQKGLYISIFWVILNMGSIVGSAIALGQNFDSKEDGVHNVTYVVFLILTFIGCIISLIMAKPEDVTRTDNSKVVEKRHRSWKEEFALLYVALKEDPWIMLLFPMFFASNYFYTWQFNDYNHALFTIRARSLNNFVYWVSEVLGTILIGYALLDARWLQRRHRAILGWCVLFVMILAINGWAYSYQRNYVRPPRVNQGGGSSGLRTQKLIDIRTRGYAAHVMLMIFYGVLDSMWQTYAYWLMGAMSNDLDMLAVFTGFYKCLQAIGGAVAWRLDGEEVPYMNIFISTWVLMATGMAFALPMVWYRVDRPDKIPNSAEAKGSIRASKTA